jgi:glycosyltransferase involved in cell wall biosynthesis
LPVNKQVADVFIRSKHTVLYSQRMMQDIYKYIQTHPVDVMHFHIVQEVIPLLALMPGVPKIITVHENLFRTASAAAAFNNYFLQLFQNQPGNYFVSISKRQQAAVPKNIFFAKVHNGIDTQVFKFNPSPKDYLFYSGRFIPEKGVAVALQAAKLAHYPMKVAGLFDPRQPVPHDFKTTVTKLLHSQDVQHYGKINQTQLVKLYGEAKALLVPIKWEEPFGLVIVEAMACGTPVIAFKNGAAPELIRDGKTGFIVRTLPEMVRAIKKIPTINRQACRDHVEKNFSVPTMTKNYEVVYEAALKDFRKRS